MIKDPKYKITVFDTLTSNDYFSDNAELRFAANTAALYYEFAFYQMMDFSTITNEMYEKELSECGPEANVYLYRAWSHAYAMYALLRTTVEAAKEINSRLNLSVDATYQRRVKEIIDIANDIVKHPIFNGSGSCAHRPLSLYRWGDIEVQKWVDQMTPSTQIIISPEKDFYSIQNYLDHIATLTNSGQPPIGK